MLPPKDPGSKGSKPTRAKIPPEPMQGPSRFQRPSTSTAHLLVVVLNTGLWRPSLGLSKLSHLARLIQVRAQCNRQVQRSS